MPLDNLSGTPVIRLDQPLLKWPSSKPSALPSIDLSIPVQTVSTSAVVLQQQFSARDHAIQKVEKMLDAISARQCLYCFVDGTTHTNTTTHASPPRHNILTSKFTKARADIEKQFPKHIQMPANIHVPFCYCCWVPLRQVGSNHPIPAQGERWDHSKCPYSSVHKDLIPTLIAYIWTQWDKMTLISGNLGVVWKQDKSEEFRKWLCASVGATEVQHHFQFLNAFYDTCISLEN